MLLMRLWSNTDWLVSLYYIYWFRWRQAVWRYSNTYMYLHTYMHTYKWRVSVCIGIRAMVFAQYSIIYDTIRYDIYTFHIMYCIRLSIWPFDKLKLRFINMINRPLTSPHMYDSFLDYELTFFLLKHSCDILKWRK